MSISMGSIKLHPLIPESPVSSKIGRILERQNCRMMSVYEWRDLNPDMLLLAASKLTVLEDFMALRGVCRSWRAVVTRDMFSRASKIPLLMLSEKNGNGDNVREFYSLCKNKVCMRMAFPEATGRRCLDAGFGWILIAPARNTDGDITLVKIRPLMDSSSHPKIQLPDTTSFPGYTSMIGGYRYIKQAVLSANPSETSDFVLMVSCNNFAGLGFWKKGENTWTGINKYFYSLFPSSICYCKQKFHVLDVTAKYVYVWDPFANETEPRPVFSLSRTFSSYMWPYLAPSSKGELLFITRFKNFNDATKDPFGAAFFNVVRIDAEKRTSMQVTDLKGDAVFIGQNTAVCVAADNFPGVIKPNRIYFTDDYTEAFTPLIKGGMDMGIYNVEDGSGEIFDVKSYSHICAPIWICPS